MQHFIISFQVLCLLMLGMGPQKVLAFQQPVDEVYPLLDAANSRWFYFASASRPFGMVNLSPDTQVGGAWGSGYRYDTDTIKGFSHVHGWQIAGVSVMPVNYDSLASSENYYSKFSHEDEVVEVGYHKVYLERYGIDAELTSTKRVGFHKYTYEEGAAAGIVFQLSGKLGPSNMKDGVLDSLGTRVIYGSIVNEPTRRRPKEFKVYFVVQFDTDYERIESYGSDYAMVRFGDSDREVHMKVALSYTSHENALENLAQELPDWDFAGTVKESKSEWNTLLNRIQVSDEDPIAKRRFYTDLWHSLQGRRTISDVNGTYPDYTGPEFMVGQVPLAANGTALHHHYNSDSFWGAQWTLNTLWGILYPDVYSEFVKSLMLYHDDGGLIPRGPSGGNYTYVMTGASSTPFVVSAFQKNIDLKNPNKVYEALKKNHLSAGIMSKAGYEHETTLGGGLGDYIELGFVPYPNPAGKFGYHQDGASLTMEYAYQDFTLAQMAKALGYEEDYKVFIKRSMNYRNTYDKKSGWMRPKDISGKWLEPFDPYQYEHGFNESNGAQSTWFVPHDIEGLAELMGGKEAAVQKLTQQFEESAARGFTSGDSHERGEDPTRARIPINYGNQPSIQTAFIFSELGRPDLTQYWTSRVVRSTFSDLDPHGGYKGDEDQGLMGALAVLMKIGLFQMNGGTEADPRYTLVAPLFSEVSLDLPNGRNLEIMKEGKGEGINRVEFQGAVLETRFLRHSELMTGGKLVYYMKE